MESLPPEILLEIFQWLHKSEIQTVALVNRQMARLTEAIRWEALRLTRNLADIITVLTQHPGHQRLSNYVKELIFDLPSDYSYWQIHEVAVSNCLSNLHNLKEVSWTRRTKPPLPLQSLPSSVAQRLESISILQRTPLSETVHRLNGTLFPNIQKFALWDSFFAVPYQDVTLADTINSFVHLRSLILSYLDSDTARNLHLPHLEEIGIGCYNGSDGDGELVNLLASPLLRRISVLAVPSCQSFTNWLRSSPSYPRLRSFRIGGEPGEEYFEEILAPLITSFLESHLDVVEIALDFHQVVFPETVLKVLGKVNGLEHFAAQPSRTGSLHGSMNMEATSALIHALPRTLCGLEMQGWSDIPRDRLLSWVKERFPTLRYLRLDENDGINLFEATKVAKECQSLEWVEIKEVWRVVRRDQDGSLVLQDLGVGARHPFAPKEPRRQFVPRQ